MPFSKTFPKQLPGVAYPQWEEVYLTGIEEKSVDEAARQENIRLLKECIDDVKKIFIEKGLKDFQSDIIQAAIALFEKRSSHAVYWRERKAKEKFDISSKKN